MRFAILSLVAVMMLGGPAFAAEEAPPGEHKDAASNDQKPGGAVATYIGERRAAAHPRFTATRSYAPQVRMSVTPGCFSDSTRTCTVFPQAVE